MKQPLIILITVLSLALWVIDVRAEDSGDILALAQRNISEEVMCLCDKIPVWRSSLLVGYCQSGTPR